MFCWFVDLMMKTYSTDNDDKLTLPIMMEEAVMGENERVGLSLKSFLIIAVEAKYGGL